MGLNSLARELKHYAAYYFAYRLWCVGGLNQWGGGQLTENTLAHFVHSPMVEIKLKHIQEIEKNPIDFVSQSWQ